MRNNKKQGKAKNHKSIHKAERREAEKPTKSRKAEKQRCKEAEKQKRKEAKKQRSREKQRSWEPLWHLVASCGILDSMLMAARTWCNCYSMHLFLFLSLYSSMQASKDKHMQPLATKLRSYAKLMQTCATIGLFLPSSKKTNIWPSTASSSIPDRSSKPRRTIIGLLSRNLESQTAGYLHDLRLIL